MNVLFISSSRTRGGGEVWLSQICRGLIARGHDISVVCQPGSKLEGHLGTIPVRLFRLRMAGDFNPFTILRLYRIIRRNGIDIVRANMEKELRLGGIAALMARVPIIVSREVDFPIKNKIINRYFYNRVARGIMVNSHATHNTLLVSAPWLSDQAFEVVWKGIDTDHYDKAGLSDLRGEFNIGVKDCVAGFVGRLDEQKGIPTLLVAMKDAIRENPRLKLILVGEGNLRGMIDEFRRKNRLENHLIMTGFREDIPAVLRAIDFLVMPSYWEGFGYSAVEAMAAGKPVIGTATSSLPEIIEDGRTGILVPPRSAGDLAKAILELADDRRRQIEMGHAGRIRARKLFRLTSMVIKTESFFRSALGSRYVPARHPLPALGQVGHKSPLHISRKEISRSQRPVPG